MTSDEEKRVTPATVALSRLTWWVVREFIMASKRG